MNGDLDDIADADACKRHTIFKPVNIPTRILEVEENREESDEALFNSIQH